MRARNDARTHAPTEDPPFYHARPIANTNYNNFLINWRHVICEGREPVLAGLSINSLLSIMALYHVKIEDEERSIVSQPWRSHQSVSAIDIPERYSKQEIQKWLSRVVTGKDLSNPVG